MKRSRKRLVGPIERSSRLRTAASSAGPGAPVNDQLNSLALIKAQTPKISSSRVIHPSILPLIKGSMASGFTSACH